MQGIRLFKIIQVLLLFYLVIAGLHFAKPFLVPICFAGLLAMLFLPLCRWLESKSLNRGLSAIICILTFLILIISLFILLYWQVADLAGDLTGIQQKVKQMIEGLKRIIQENFGITPKQQEQIIQNGTTSTGGSQASGILTNLGSTIFGFLVDFILVLVYMFLFMYFRTHLKRFILKIVPTDGKRNTQEILSDIQKVAQQYLGGLGMMIVGLWIMYSIGFSIAGIDNPIFFAILCGILEIVPFVGNLTGTAITVMMALTQGGGASLVIGIIATYMTVQFIQTYILEPLVVGAEVNVNPLFTIIAIVLGELIWGIPGMVLSIPLLGIFKIVCDNIEPLKPYGFLIGDVQKQKTKITDRIKNLFSKKKSK